MSQVQQLSKLNKNRQFINSQKMKLDSEGKGQTCFQRISTVSKEEVTGIRSEIKMDNELVEVNKQPHDFKNPQVLDKQPRKEQIAEGLVPGINANRKNNIKQQPKQKPRTVTHAFYISSGRQNINNNYERLKAIRAEYSHEKTSEIVKQVQSKIKSWMGRQKTSEKLRQRFVERQIQQQQKSLQLQIQQQRKSIQTKKQEYKKEVTHKIKLRQQSKLKQKEQMQRQTISKMMLRQKKLPLFVQKQREFEQKMKEQQVQIVTKIKQRKKQLIEYSPQFLKQHQDRYGQYLKQRFLKQEKKSSHKILPHTVHQPPSLKPSFTTLLSVDQQGRERQQRKKLRVKQYVQKLKSMSPDKTTLERIRRVKESIVQSQKIMVQQEGNSKLFRDRRRKNYQAFSMMNLIARGREDVAEKQVDIRKKIGDQYLRQLKQSPRHLALQNRDNGEDVGTLVNRIEKQQPQLIARRTDNPSGQFCINMTNNLEDQSQKRQKSCQITTQHSNRLKRTMKNESSLLFQNKYKNYLIQLKLKPTRPLTQLQKVRHQFKDPSDMVKQYNKQSQEIQRNMYKKINQIKKKQKSERYEKSLQKQGEVDELLKRSIQVKLACLSIS